MPNNKVNIQRFQELSDGDSESLLELINLYLTKTAEQITELEKAIKSNTPGEIARVAHSMVGASMMVGLDSLVPLLRGLERSGEEKNSQKARLDFEAFRKEYMIVQAELTQVGNGLQKLES